MAGRLIATARPGSVVLSPYAKKLIEIASVGPRNYGKRAQMPRKGRSLLKPGAYVATVLSHGPKSSLRGFCPAKSRMILEVKALPGGLSVTKDGAVVKQGVPVEVNFRGSGGSSWAHLPRLPRKHKVRGGGTTVTLEGMRLKLGARTRDPLQQVWNRTPTRG